MQRVLLQSWLWRTPRGRSFALTGLAVGCFGLLLGTNGLRSPTSLVASAWWAGTLTLAFGAGIMLGRQGFGLPGGRLVVRALDAFGDMAHWAGFEARLEEELHRAERTKIPFSLILVHLDQLASIDSLHGRAVADHLLFEIGRIVRRACRARDVVARWGDGDAFAVLAPWTNGRQAMILAERLCAAVRRPRRRLDWVGPVSFSVGVTDLEQALSFNSGEVFRAAIIALGEAQAGGGDRATMAVPPPPSEPQRRQSDWMFT